MTELDGGPALVEHGHLREIIDARHARIVARDASAAYHRGIWRNLSP
jgi:hypothetical protein